MAGAKERSGGPRPNAGGARPGAGRKPKADGKSANAPKSANATSVTEKLEAQPHGGALKRKKAETAEIAERDMLQLLQDIALGRVEASTGQIRAAIAAVQYTHTKKGDGGKKDEVADKASKAANKFAATPPPLRAVK